VTPAAGRFLAKAEKLLAEAGTVLAVGLNEAAGRSAYLAQFHAAQALIFELTTKVLRTHAGVQTEFLRLTKDDSRFDVELRASLSRSYNLKAIADYETGPDVEVTQERAADAVRIARRFVARVGEILA
jgi:uncharacterized protein (UPF0332 family)